MTTNSVKNAALLPVFPCYLCKFVMRSVSDKIKELFKTLNEKLFCAMMLLYIFIYTWFALAIIIQSLHFHLSFQYFVKIVAKKSLFLIITYSTVLYGTVRYGTRYEFFNFIFLGFLVLYNCTAAAIRIFARQSLDVPLKRNTLVEH